MSPGESHHAQEHLDSVCLYALQALPAGDVPAVEAQISECEECRLELQSLGPVLDAFVSWPVDVLRPSTSVWERLARRITAETGKETAAEPARAPQPDWEEAAPGVFCKILAMDEAKGRVTMLVRLAPGTEYPPHVHAGVEELHMLHGELRVNEKKLYAGDYLRSEPRTADRLVWSEKGCTGLLITSVRDMLT